MGDTDKKGTVQSLGWQIGFWEGARSPSPAVAVPSPRAFFQLMFVCRGCLQGSLDLCQRCREGGCRGGMQALFSCVRSFPKPGFVLLEEAAQVGLRVEFCYTLCSRVIPWAPLRHWPGQKADTRQLPGLCCHGASGSKEYWDGREESGCSNRAWCFCVGG